MMLTRYLPRATCALLDGDVPAAAAMLPDTSIRTIEAGRGDNLRIPFPLGCKGRTPVRAFIAWLPGKTTPGRREFLGGTHAGRPRPAGRAAVLKTGPDQRDARNQQHQHDDALIAAIGKSPIEVRACPRARDCAGQS